MFRFLAFGLLLLGVLVGCGVVNNGETTSGSVSVAQQRWVEMPVLPVIQNAVLTLSQVVEPQHNEVALQHVCALARGESTQAQVNQALAKIGIDVSKIPLKGSTSSVLINGDQAQRSTLCAAYMVKNMLSVPDLSEFVIDTDKRGNGVKSAIQFDQERLSQHLRVKLAVAMTSAEIFALIATELQRTPGLTLQNYNQRSQVLFTKLAPVYLKRVKEFYFLQGTEYTLIEASDQRFAFSSDNGSIFESTRSGVVVGLNNIVWFGSGKLLGNTYLGAFEYFDSEMLRRLD